MPAKGPNEYYNDEDLTLEELADIKALHNEEEWRERKENENNS
ncbi:hypothetical protein [Longicatena caecimuris]|nr:hypothetical protein [Longicatena caecimuris]